MSSEIEHFVGNPSANARPTLSVRTPDTGQEAVIPLFSGTEGATEAVGTQDLDTNDGQEQQTDSSVPTANNKGKIRTRASKIAKVTGLTVASIIAEEGVAHVGGFILAAVPNPIDWTHNPIGVGVELLGTYGMYGISKWNNNHEAGVREDAGKLSYNKLATIFRNTARKFFPDSKKMETSGEQAGGFTVPGGFEGEYWAGSANAIGHLTSHQGGAINLLGGTFVIDHRSASFIGGANLAAAGWNSYLTDSSKYLRQQGREPRTGIRSIVDVATTVGPVTRIKVSRNVARVREKIPSRGSHETQPELTSLRAPEKTVFDGTSANHQVPPVSHQQGA